MLVKLKKIKNKPVLQEFSMVHPELKYAFAQIIADSTGFPIKAFKYDKQGQPYFIATKNLFIIQVFRFEKSYSIKIFQILKIKDNIAEVHLICRFTEQDKNPLPFLQRAISASIDKSYCFNCKASHYSI